MYLWSSLS